MLSYSFDNPSKIRLGNTLTMRIASKEGIPAEYWSLGRLGARQLLYGSLANVVTKEICEKWIEALLNADLPIDEKLAALFGQMASKTPYPEINISESVIARILNKFSASGHFQKVQEHLCNINSQNLHDKEQAFGDSLPAGLSLEFTNSP